MIRDGPSLLHPMDVSCRGNRDEDTAPTDIFALLPTGYAGIAAGALRVAIQANDAVAQRRWLDASHSLKEMP